MPTSTLPGPSDLSAQQASEYPADSPDRYVNRELSWLAFNERVLAEASNPAYPLLERLRFLSISGSNLDEFMMIRVAGLVGQVQRNIRSTSIDGRTPSQQMVAIREQVMALHREQRAEPDGRSVAPAPGWGRFSACSAGTEPTEVHPLTRRVLDEARVDASGLKAKPLSRFLG